MNVFILCGGEGTRVKEITDRHKCAKHEIPVLNRPFCDYTSSWIESSAIDFEEIFWVTTPDVGTAGAIKTLETKFHRSFIHFPILIVYGDIFTPIDLRDMYWSFLEANVDISMVTAQVAPGTDYGLVHILDSRVTSFARQHDTAMPFHTNTGTYLLGQRVYEFIRNFPFPATGSLSLENDLMQLLLQMFEVRSYPSSRPLFDVGTPSAIKLTKKLLTEYNTRHKE